MSKIIIFLCGLLWCYTISAEPLILKNNAQEHLFDVEIANTPEKSQQGLMFRKYLPANKGMLFISDTDTQMYMWMKNTYISLDMLFFDRKGKIIKIIPNTTPLSLKILSSDIPVAGVLEINAGTAKQLDINIGDLIVSEQLK
ncbi:MAG: DUF192 domain-containing protein [Alphaproteobacteria bacterium]|nr:DUF192 domain-containing protein [Alphaproteobacteria bacterium]